MSQPAPFSNAGQDDGGHQLDDQGGSRLESHVPVPTRRGARTDRARRQRRRRRARRPGRDSRGAEGSRRAASRADRDLNDHAVRPLLRPRHSPSRRRSAAASAPRHRPASTYTDLNGLAALKNAPSSPEAIRAVSQQVEALFLQMMLKSMRDASDADGELDSNETSMYQDMFDKQVALTLSKHQDLGIARLFERQLGGQGIAGHAGARAGGPRRRQAAARSKTAAAASGMPTDGSAAPSTSADIAHSTPHNSSIRCCRPSGAPPGAGHQSIGTSGAGRAWRRAGGSACRAPPTARPASICSASKRARSGTARAPSPTPWSSMAASRRSGARPFAPTARSRKASDDFANLLVEFAALSRRDRRRQQCAGVHRRASRKSGYATDPDYGNKLNQILNGSTLRAALNVRTSRHYRNGAGCR